MIVIMMITLLYLEYLHEPERRRRFCSVDQLIRFALFTHHADFIRASSIAARK